jgi:hypothetical protein
VLVVVAGIRRCDHHVLDRDRDLFVIDLFVIEDQKARRTTSPCRRALVWTDMILR